MKHSSHGKEVVNAVTLVVSRVRIWSNTIVSLEYNVLWHESSDGKSSSLSNRKCVVFAREAITNRMILMVIIGCDRTAVVVAVRNSTSLNMVPYSPI